MNFIKKMNKQFDKKFWEITEAAYSMGNILFIKDKEGVKEYDLGDIKKFYAKKFKELVGELRLGFASQSKPYFTHKEINKKLNSILGGE